jgi:hypothetical protein
MLEMFNFILGFLLGMLFELFAILLIKDIKNSIAKQVYEAHLKDKVK